MAKFRIKRYNPEKQSEPYYEEFDYDIPEGATLLDCLNHLKWNVDGTLTYRMSCRSAICGSCAMKGNGHALLACQKQAAHLLKDGSDTITIDPLGNMPVIKDLATDFQQFWDKVDQVKPYLQNKEKPPYSFLDGPITANNKMGVHHAWGRALMLSGTAVAVLVAWTYVPALAVWPIELVLLAGYCAIADRAGHIVTNSHAWHRYTRISSHSLP